MLIISSSFVVVMTVTSTVQENLNQVQTQRSEYLDIDRDLLSTVNELSNDLSNSLSTEIESLALNVLTDDEAVSNSSLFAGAFSSARSLLERLRVRQNTANYQFEGIEEGVLGLGLLSQELPDTSNVIDTSANGAEGIMDQFVSTGISEIGQLRAGAQELKDEFETIENSFQSIQGNISETLISYDTNLSDLESSLFADGSVDAVNVLEQLSLLDENMRSIANSYQSILAGLVQDPNVTPISNFNALISSTSTNLDTINSTIFGFGTLTGQDAVLYNATIFGAFGIISGYSDAFEELNSYTALVDDIAIQIDEGILPMVQEVNSILSDVIRNLEVEIAEFSKITDGFIIQLRADLSNFTQLLSTLILIVTFLVFTLVFLAISRNYGRILSKISNLADGNLDIQTEDTYNRNEIGAIEEGLDIFVIQTRSIVKSAKEVAEVLAGISEELAAGAEEASASINQVNSTVRQFSSGSSEQNLMLSRVRDELITHLTVVEETATNIDETAKFVLRVAKRTNILGLNASIEAAKAGRFGLGFDIVAEEVRKLSTETRESAGKIASNIEEIEFNIRKTVEDILDEVNIIREVAENTSQGSEEASVATQEQVTMMNEVSETSNQLSQLSAQLNNMLQNFKA